MSATKELLLASAERDLDILSAEIERLETINAELQAALEAVWADLADPDSESWVIPAVGRQVRAAIAQAKSGGAS